MVVKGGTQEKSKLLMELDGYPALNRHFPQAETIRLLNS